MKHSDKIYIAGHRGLVGSALVRKLTQDGFSNLLLRTSSELDLRNQDAVHSFFSVEKPDYVFLAAAKVGGILANNLYPGAFIYENLSIQTHLIHESYLAGVQKLLFLGSSCIYPKLAPQPMRESDLLTGPLEPTNAPYAIAKIAGITMCQSYNRQYGTSFISVMPTNLYGPNDSYDLQNSHVLPALIRKFHEAKLSGVPSVELWGTGTPSREFLHADDLADACCFLMQNYSSSDIINIGVGSDIQISDLAHLIKNIVGYAGKITYDTSKPDGTPRKLLDVTRLSSLGWHPKISLEDGVKATYRSYVESISA